MSHDQIMSCIGLLGGLGAFCLAAKLIIDGPKHPPFSILLTSAGLGALGAFVMVAAAQGLL